ncbi:MAG: 3-phosphoshikimate 1-carboxyvinyltransferase, partial [Lachnospiraceae bacterium]|nr:3-phosphoshikimate 1-carboxyvinyltransferase [Lachnospiraceae bacterium]
MKLTKVKGFSGEVTVPGDKSISHRSIMLGSLAKGTTEVYGFLQGADCLSSIDCFRKMGVEIENNGTLVTIKGRGLRGLMAPSVTLDVGNSGTTTRLMSGILAAQNFTSRVNGDASIQKRPMKRIMTPLSMMGADITSELGNDCAPLIIRGKELKGI